jgi:hypothetical protein
MVHADENHHHILSSSSSGQQGVGGSIGLFETGLLGLFFEVV